MQTYMMLHYVRDHFGIDEMETSQRHHSDWAKATVMQVWDYLKCLQLQVFSSHIRHRYMCTNRPNPSWERGLNTFVLWSSACQFFSTEIHKHGDVHRWGFMSCGYYRRHWCVIYHAALENTLIYIHLHWFAYSHSKDAFNPNIYLFKQLTEIWVLQK